MRRELVVLAVDDEPANQRAVRRALIDDCRVVVAGSGEEALAVLARQSVALVIVDQRMPVMTGTEFLDHAVRLYPEIIRVVLTGYADIDTLVRAINAGRVYHFLSKPWEAHELRQVVRRGLERYAVEADRVRLMEALELACVSARREAAQKSRLLTMTAHELGTPLHILLNAISFLEVEAVPSAARRWVEAAQRASDWLTRGVTRMHAAGRVADRHLCLRPERMDLRAVVEEVVTRVRAALDGRQLQLSSEVTTTCDHVVADRRWMQQALWDLLTNAVRFTPDGGWIRVEGQVEEERIAVSVRDSGIGIRPEHLEELFEPFSAATGDPLLHGSGRFAFGARGLGLGLAMVKGIAEAHGGTVQVTSHPNAGSCFVLTLPRVATGEMPPRG